MTNGGSRFRRALTAVAVGTGLLAVPGLSAFQSSASAATVPFTGAYFDSEHGEYVGQGQQMTFPSVTLTYNRGPYFTVSNGTVSFTIDFYTPPGVSQVVPGTYTDTASGFGTNPNQIMLIAGDGRGCNSFSRYIVDDATYDAAGNLLTFEARFESHCTTTTPALFGYVSYNSTAPVRTRTLSANTLTFPGSPGLAVQQKLTITNGGPASDTPAAFSVTGTDATYFSIVGTTCGNALAAGGSCTVTISYTEAVINRTASATLLFTDDLAPPGPPNAPAGIGRGRSVPLNGIAGLATVTGVITGAGGVPLPGVCVGYALPGNTQFVQTQGESGSDGTYSLTVQPGTYAFNFTPGSNCNGLLSPYSPQIYSNATDVAHETTVAVVGGQVTTGINAQLVIGGAITGRVTDSNGTPLAQVRVTTASVGAVPFAGQTVLTDANGVYSVESLATGQYTVEYVYWPTPTTSELQWYQGATAATSTLVNVTAGQSTTGINTVFPASTTSGGTGTGSGGTGTGSGGTGTGGGGTGAGGGGSTWGSGSTGGTDTPTPEAGPLVRVAGVDRIGTAVAASRTSFPTGNAGAVVLADAMNYPDALVGAPLAAARNAPLLLTDGDLLPAATFSELKRVLPTGRTVYLLGGTGPIPSSAADEITSAGYTVVRYAGADRFATAAAVAVALGNPSTVLLATGTGFPDALAAGPAAAHVHGAVLLTDGSAMAPATADYLAAHKPTVYAIGGAAATAAPAARPIMGTDRFATAADVATTFFAAPTELGFAIGTAFPDALSGGAQLALADAPLLLVARVDVPASTDTYIAMHSSVTGGYLYGGAAVVGSTVMSALDTAISGP